MSTEKLGAIISEESQLAPASSTDFLQGAGIISSESALVRTRRKIAAATGEVYRFALETYLKHDDDSSKKETIEESAGATLPPRLHALFSRVLGKFEEQLNANAQRLEAVGIDNCGALLSPKLEAKKVSEQEADDIALEVEDARIEQPTRGLPIMHVNPRLFDLLKGAKLFGEGASAVYFHSSDGQAGFAVIPIDPRAPHRDNSKKLHETSHLFVDFIVRRGAAKTNEAKTAEHKDLEERKRIAFEALRDEVVAYIVSGGTFEDVEADYLVYSKESSIQILALDARDFLSMCMKIAASYGVSQQDFIYPAARAKNLEDMKARFIGIVPRDVTGDMWFFDQAHSLVSKRPGALKVVKELVSSLGISTGNLDSESFFWERERANLSSESLKVLIGRVEIFRRLCRVLGINTFSLQNWLEKVLAKRLDGLPAKTIKTIIAERKKGSKVTLYIPTMRVCRIRAYLEDLIVVPGVNQPEVLKAIKRIINSSGEVRKVFEDNRLQLANYACEDYARFWGKDFEDEENHICEDLIGLEIKLARSQIMML